MCAADLGPVAVIPDSDWLGAALIGLYQPAVAILGLVLAIQLVGTLYWGVEGRLDAWRAWIQAAGGVGATPFHGAAQVLSSSR